MTTGKVADLAGPGIGNYEELEKILPEEYSSLLTRRETQKAIFALKRFIEVIEDNLCKHLNLMMVTVPVVVDVESGVNDMLDRDGSRTPIQFHIANSARRRSFRSALPSSPSALAIRSTTAILTKCAPPITTIGSRKQSMSMERLTTA
jgi:hypothetical protein